MGCILSEEEHEDLDDSHFSELDKNKEMLSPNNRITQVQEAGLITSMKRLNINDSSDKQDDNGSFHKHRRESGKHTSTTTIKNEDSNVRLPPVAGSVASFNFPKFFDDNRQKSITSEDQYINDLGLDELDQRKLKVEERKNRKVIISWPMLVFKKPVKYLCLRGKDSLINYPCLSPMMTSIEITYPLARKCLTFQLYAVDINFQETFLLSSEEIWMTEKPQRPEGPLNTEELPNLSVLISWPPYICKSNIVNLLLAKEWRHKFEQNREIRVVDATDTECKFDGLLIGTEYRFKLIAVNKLEEESLPLCTSFQLTDAPLCPRGPLSVSYLPDYKVRVSWPKYTREDVDHLCLKTISASKTSLSIALSVSETSSIIDVSPDENYDFELVAVNKFKTESKPLRTLKPVQLPEKPVKPNGPLEVKENEFMERGSVRITWPQVTGSQHLKELKVYMSKCNSQNNPRIFTLPLFRTCLYVENLKLKSNYTFQLVTVNVIDEESPPLSAVAVFQSTDIPPSPLGPLKVTEVNDDVISVQWKHPSCKQESIECYKVYSSGLTEIGTANPRVTECVIYKDLLQRQCKISVLSENKFGDQSQPLLLEKPPVPNGPVEFDDISLNSISLSWTKPKETGCQLKNFVIEYSENETMLEKIIPFSNECKTTIENLKKSQKYRFSIMTENIFGERSEKIYSEIVTTGQHNKGSKENTSAETKGEKTKDLKEEETNKNKKDTHTNDSAKHTKQKESTAKEEKEKQKDNERFFKSATQAKQNESKKEKGIEKQKDEQYKYQSERMIQGIPNIGFTCYANSILQVLGQTPGFVETLERYLSADDSNSMAFLLFSILKSINTTDGLIVSDAFVRRLMSKIFSVDTSFERFRQNDCHSFLMCLFNGIKEENSHHRTTGEGENTPIKMFEGEIKNVFKYNTCEHIEYSEAQSFTSLLIPIPSNRNYTGSQTEIWTVEKGLAILMEKEHFKNNILPCSFCEAKNGATDNATITTKTTEIKQAPKILILQIGRFREHASENHPHKSTLRKVHSAVGYKKELKVPVTDGKKTVKKTYNLYAVVLHFGTLNGGHYYSYVKANNSTRKWFYCSDSSVFEVSESDIHRESDQAYLLCYHLNEK